MIPTFPEFRNIMLSDKSEVQNITSQFDAYSDFNFSSLWSWNLSGKTQLSLLDGNLAIKLNGYINNEPIYSILGKTNIKNSIDTLLEFSYRNKSGPLKLVPEVVIDQIESDGNYIIIEDRDNADYIYDLFEQSTYLGRDFAKKRNLVNAFLRNFPLVETRQLELSNDTDTISILTLLKRIHETKTKDGTSSEFDEIKLFERFLLGKTEFILYITGIFIENTLCAVMFSEKISDVYSIGHIMAADLKKHPGIYTYLMMKNAEILYKNGAHFFNFEQDLGLENLRIAKSRFRPIKYLKKYTVEKKTPNSNIMM